MEEYIAFDSHKRYTWVDRQDHATGKATCHRLEHAPGAVREYLHGCEPGTAVAVEATGNWYWIIDEIEQAGLVPRLVHPRKAKLMMGQINKTDKLDAQGLNRLQRNGTLPTVWIPPGPLRDLRELTRTRLVLVAQRTRLKNRLSATLAKWGLPASEYSDPYGKRGRAALAFLASGAYLYGLLASAAIGIYPYVLPARDPALGITLHDAAAAKSGLAMGLSWWIPGMVLACGYLAYMYATLPAKFRVRHKADH